MFIGGVGMMLSESIVDAQRMRLPNRTERVNRTTGFSALGGIVFGYIFVGVGVAIILVGLKAIPVNPANIRAPYWVISFTGGMFTMGGILVWTRVLQEQLLVKRRQTLSAQHPRSEIFADYPWNPQGISKSLWSKVFSSLVAILAFAGFLTPFNWWAWGADGVLIFITCLVSLFDLLWILGVYELFRRILAALKYGSSSIKYEHFPFITGERVGLRWSVPSGCQNTESITFVLRCVEEWTESTGAGDDRSTILIHEQLWAATRTTVGRLANWPSTSLSVTFDVPATASGSYLSGEPRITFWELQVCTTAPGVDFEERYLVPVYRGASS